MLRAAHIGELGLRVFPCWCLPCVHNGKQLNGQVQECREGNDEKWDKQDLIRSDNRGIVAQREETKRRARKHMDQVKAGDFVAMATIDEVEDEEGVSYYIAEIKERPDGTSLEQKASSEHARALKGRTQCPLNEQPVVKHSPLFLARYWVRKPDLHFEEGEYGECEVNGEGFRFVVPASDFVVAEQRAKRQTRSRARHPKASPKRVLSLAAHGQIKEVLRA